MGESLAPLSTGQENTTVRYEETSGTGDDKRTTTHTAYGCHRFLDSSMRVANVPSGVIERGQNEYPISFFVPHGSPASMVIGCYLGDSGSVSYTLHVWLDRPGAMRWDVKNEIQITITVPAPMQQSIPYWIEPADVEIKTCSCFSRGNVLAGAVVESAVVSKGSTVWVNYALENQSTSRVKAIEITLHQFARFLAEGYHGGSPVVVFHIRMTPQQAGLDLKALNSSDRGGAEAHSKALNRLRETLQSGALSRKFEIGPHAAESYQGTLLQVSHTLSVKICTPFGTASPMIHCPIRICSETGNWVGGSAAQPSAPPLPADWAPVVAQAVVYPAMQLGNYGDVAEPDGTPVVYVDNLHVVVEKGVGFDSLMQTLQSPSCFDPCFETEQWLNNNNNNSCDFSPDDLYALFAAVKKSFDKTRMAGIVAQARQGRQGTCTTFTCAHVAAAC
eukprot:CAMPEP_0173284364 /NCGR_PEP_ID=MMETSP1143-20121109/7984_1 /TAXON_ID=483371 /ORGANISM="non described non described, Strain CCMP2298" /LENGTH=445 /DNA_ID=CAMNT_0014222337 /DNA_START=247 /DNA_END=1581 /DNA_ORIENTATION=+